MDNYQIADHLNLLSKLTDIHGENEFKAKSYASTAFAVERLAIPLADTPAEKIPGIKGIGSSSGQKIIELIQTGKMRSLEDIISRTPSGIIEMLQIKGIGPKKIRTIWKEMEIETIGELLYACKENRLKLYKGFGEKTQQQVISSIEFYQQNTGNHLYAQVEKITGELYNVISSMLPGAKLELTGQFLRQLEVIDKVEFLIKRNADFILEKISTSGTFPVITADNELISLDSGAGIKIILYPCAEEEWAYHSLKYSSSEPFFEALNLTDKKSATTEKAFASLQLPFLPPYLREDPALIPLLANRQLPEIISTKDIRGIIHSHSNWSDGSNTIEEMAKACMERGLEYLVVSDHSRSAFYAQGLHVEKIVAQHQLIDELNSRLKPFKIFKSIESDILSDGSLDYEENILQSFDLVIASVHSNLKMTEEKAMSRLLRAIENPYTTILGHMTGRLLLSRPGYPVDHKKIIDACAANHVAIELNAHPSRLDIDWRQISYALEKNVLISINPDAHTIEGLDDVKYGVLVAQKAMLSKENNLSSYSLSEFEKYLSRKSAGL